MLIPVKVLDLEVLAPVWECLRWPVRVCVAGEYAVL